jgi:hypothetical protein
MHIKILITLFLFAVSFSTLANAEEATVDKGAQIPGKSVKKPGKMGIFKKLAESGMLKNLKKQNIKILYLNCNLTYLSNSDREIRCTKMVASEKF